MNVLINCLLLNQQNTGVQNSIENSIIAMNSILKENINIEVLLSNNYIGKLDDLDKIKITKLNFNSKNRLIRIGWEHFFLPFRLLKQKPDIFHGPGYILPQFCPVPGIVTVHDLLTLQHPEWCKNESALYFKWALPRSIKHASKIIAVSETVKNEIINILRINPEKINVIYHGVSTEFRKTEDLQLISSVRNKYKLPEKFILSLGNLEPKKNLVRLIQAFDKLKINNNITHHLVLAGRSGWKTEPIFKAYKNSKNKTYIHFPGYIDQSDVPTLYTLSDLFVFPSLFEGFGLPVIEAMACGTPVVASNAGALPEITGGASLLFDPYDIDQIEESIYRMLSEINTRKAYIQKGLERANFFSWEKNANELINMYQSL